MNFQEPQSDPDPNAIRCHSTGQPGQGHAWYFGKGPGRVGPPSDPYNPSLPLSSLSLARLNPRRLSNPFWSLPDLDQFVILSKMSSLRNAIPRRAHKERSQPEARKKFGILEKHKDYVIRAKAFHKKEEALRKLKEKAEFRNPDEFYFKMIHTKTVNGVHMPPSEANKYTQEELMLMKTQDMGYILQKIQSEKKKIERLTSVLHTLDNQPSNKRVFYAEDREEAKDIQSKSLESSNGPILSNVPVRIRKKTVSSYREVESRKQRVQQLEKLYSGMALQKELQKSGRKRKLREDEMVSPTNRPVYKWRAERKR